MKDPRNILEKALSRNEPVFVVRAQDKLSIVAINMYCLAAYFSDISTEQLTEIYKIREDFQKWQKENPDKVKMPD